MKIPAFSLFTLFAAISTLTAQIEGAEEAPGNLADPRFVNFSPQIFPDLQPGFTTEDLPEFTIDLSGIGRESITITSLSVNIFNVPREAWVFKNGSVSFRPVRPLVPGLNRITVTYEHPTDRKHSENPLRQTFYVNYRPEGPSFASAADGTFLVNGKRVFPLGSYRSGLTDQRETSLPDARAAGFNLVHDYYFSRPVEDADRMQSRIEDARAYLMRAQELGLGVFLDIPRNLLRDFDKNPALHEELLAQYICALSPLPSLWLWYIWDEPQIDPSYTKAFVNPANAARVHALLRRLDPQRPTVMLCNKVEPAYAFSPFCEIFWVDRYPFIASAPELSSIAPVVALLRKGQEIVQGKKPVWPVIQLQDNRVLPHLAKNLPPIASTDHRPSPREVAAQIQACVAAGAPAVVTYHAPANQFSMKSIPDHWEGLARVFSAARELEPVWISEEPRPNYEAIESSDKILSWTRSLDGKAYYGFVNLSVNQPSRTVIRPSASGEPAVLLGDGKLSPDGKGKLTIDLPPGGFAVFSITHPTTKSE